MNKKRGIAAERELLHLLFSKGFACCRVAGSGSIPEPSCDLLAGNTKKRYAIEVKTSRKEKKYLDKKQINEFLLFSKNFGLTPMIAIKFRRKGWHFIKPEKLNKTEKGYVISLEDIKKRGTNIIK